MKYTSTSRIVNLVINALVFLGFGALGCFFSFFVSPGFFVSVGDWAMKFNTSYSWNFSMLLGGLGLAMMILGCLGTLLSVKALKGNNDDDVRRVFLVYIAMGYVAAFWFFLNAALYYRAIGGAQFGFWIVMFLILMIGALIGSNVPMAKLLEDKDPNIIQGIIAGSAAVVAFSFLLNSLPTLFVTMSQTGNYGRILSQLTTYSIIAFVAMLLSGGACFLFAKAHKDGEKESKIAQILSPAALVVIGGGFITSATFEYFYSGKKFASMNAVSPFSVGFPKPADYVVMSYIVGCLIVIVGLILLASVLLPEKKASAKA